MMKNALRIFGGLGIALFALGSGSCAEPVHDQEVKALGGERDGVPTGEFHRAGQPCVTCHGEYGPASMRFSIGGTIFAGPGRPVGVDQAEVYLVDSNGVRPTHRIFTNCVGNFYVTPDVWDPAYPVLVWIRKPGETAWLRMNSHIGREGSCNQCHQDAPPPNPGPTFNSPGHIHLYPTDRNTPDPTCPATPVAAIPGGPVQ